MAQPLVTVRLLTRNRRIFARQALKYVFSQTYQPLELLIVDSGDRKLIEHHFTESSIAIRYLPVERASIGVLSNLACEKARGEIIVHFDDDDWQSPTRVQRQVDALIASEADLVQTSTFYAYHLTKGGRFWAPRPEPQTGFAAGGTFCHWKNFTERFPFRDVRKAHDTACVRDLRAAGGKIHDMCDPSLFIYTIHGKGNGGHEWLNVRTTPAATQTVRDLMGADFGFYQDLEDLLPVPERSHTFTGLPPYSGMVRR